MNEQEEFKGKADVERYLAKLRADRLSERTVEKEWGYLKVCLKYLGKLPQEITLQDIDQWKYEMSVTRKYQSETVWASLIILRKFLRHLGKNDIAEKIKIPKRPSKIPAEKEIWLLPEEQKVMIEKSKEMSIRDYAVIKLLLSSGVRAGELEKINLSDIDFSKQTIYIRKAKGGKSRIVCFDSETKEALQEYLKTRETPPEDYDALFVTEKGKKRLAYSGILYVVKECAVLAGMTKNITPHKLRHTFVTNIIEKTKDIPLAQKLAGHSDIKTTMRYHHSAQEEVITKYMELFDEKATNNMSRLPTSEEIIRALDMKFLKGEIPYGVYIELKSKYAENELKYKSKEKDIAYS